MSDEIENKKTTMEQYFRQGAFVILMLLVLFATFQLYFALENTIRIWFEYQYIPIFRALYNIAILAISLYLIVHYFVKK